MTWKQLAERIAKMSQEQQETDVTVLMMNSDEVIQITDFVDNWDEEVEEKCVSQVDGILDDNHPYLTAAF